MRSFVIVIFLCAYCAWAEEPAQVANAARYYGLSDASAAVAVTTNLFLVADDEQNVLQLYSTEHPGPPLAQYDLNAFLEVRGKFLEADLEGAAKIGDRVYWIGSHGRNRIGKERFNRCRLFATDITVKGGKVSVTPVGKPYKRLLDDLFDDPRFAKYRFPRAANRAPKEPGALAIEGMAATPEGELLIGFRNPIYHGSALIIPLLNPNEVILGKPPRLGSAVQLDLGGLGIRDLALWKDTYLVLAGPFGFGGPFRLYEWRGDKSTPEPFPVTLPEDLNPEAIVIYPDRGLQEFQLLSDDGMRLVNGVPMREIKDRRDKSFRSVWVKP